MAIPQADLRPLDSELAKRLVNSTIPRRLAYIAKDRTPRGHFDRVLLGRE